MLRTCKGYQSPVGSILIDSEWKAASQISDLPFIDHDYYGEKIFGFRVELQLLGVIVAFNKNYQLVVDCFKMPASMTAEATICVLECIRHVSASEDFVRKVKEKIQLSTTSSYIKRPSECFLFNSEWGCLLQIFSEVPFINETFYGPTIILYKDELKILGVVVDFEDAAKVFSDQFKQHASSFSITKENMLSFLSCYRQLDKTSYQFPKELIKCIREEKWLQTHMGYSSPCMCLLFSSEWSSFLQCEDGPFIDEDFYGSTISLYSKELNAIGVITVDVKSGCPLLASHLKSHSQFTTISRIYNYLSEFSWEPDNKADRWIFIPNGSNIGEWVSAEECVLHDKDDSFGLQLHVLGKHYDNKLLNFFHAAFGVRKNPSVDDCCKLWNEWESSKKMLTSAECRAFWQKVVKDWNSKTEKLFLHKFVKVPVSSVSNTVLLLDKNDVFIPDDLLLKDLFEKASPDHPLFVWYPQTNLPSVTKGKLNAIYSNIGVRTLSESIHKEESWLLDVAEVKQVNSRRKVIKRDLIRVILSFLGDPSLEMDVEKRHEAVKCLLDVTVFETNRPIARSYGLTLSTGRSLKVEVNKMIHWDRENMKLYILNINKANLSKKRKIDGSLSIDRAKIEYATHFSEVIAEVLLREKPDRIAELCELIKLVFLLELEEEAIGFLLKTKNLQLCLEDEEFLKSAFLSD